MKIVAQVEKGNLTEVAVSAAPQVGVSLAAGAQMLKAEISYGNDQKVELLVPGAVGPTVEATRQNVAAEVRIPSSAQIVIGVLPRGVQNTLDNALFLVQEGRDFVFQTANWVGGIRGEIENYRNDVLNGVIQIDGIVETRVLALGTSLETSLREELETYVLTNYYTITGTQAAIAGALTSFGAQFTNDIQQVTSTLTQDYYTAVQVDQAISSATLTLVSELESPSGTIGQVTALLGSDYYTIAQTNGAISAANLSLLSQISTTEGSQIVSNFAFDSAAWTGQAFGAPADVPQVSTDITFVTDGSQRLLVGPVGSFPESIAVWTKQTLACIPGNTYRVRVVARSVDSTTTQLRIRLNLLGADYSFLASLTGAEAKSTIPAGATFENYLTDFTIPMSTTASFVRGGVFFNHTAAALLTPIQILSIEVLDITPINTLKASIENDYYTRAQADTAIATATSVLGSEVDNLAATVTTQGTALATLESNASATLAFRTKAGTQGAELELIAQSNPQGSVSVARISASNIILNGSVTATQIAANAITATQIAAGAITADKIAAEAIKAGSAIIAEGAIGSAQIGDLQVNSAKIANLTVGTDKITPSAVTDAAAIFSPGALEGLWGQWATVYQFNYNGVNGAPVILFFSCDRDTIFHGTTSGGTSSYNITNVRVLHNGTEIFVNASGQRVVYSVNGVNSVVVQVMGWYTGNFNYTWGGRILNTNFYAIQLKR